MNVSRKDIEAIWAQYKNAMFNFILKRVPDNNVAEDILQDVFIKILGTYEKLNSVNNIQGWIYRITKNSIADYYRSRKEFNELPEYLSYPANDTDQLQELSSCMIPMIENLPDIYRKSVILSEIEGLTQKQISQKLGISYSGAKSRVQRGRAMLKDILFNCCEIELNKSGTVVNYHKINNECC